MNHGFISEWNSDDQLGQIHGCDTRILFFPFSGDDCCPKLQQELAKPENRIIRSDGPCPGLGAIQVEFDLDANGNAISVCRP